MTEEPATLSREFRVFAPEGDGPKSIVHVDPEYPLVTVRSGNGSDWTEVTSLSTVPDSTDIAEAVQVGVMRALANHAGQDLSIVVLRRDDDLPCSVVHFSWIDNVPRPNRVIELDSGQRSKMLGEYGSR